MCEVQVKLVARLDGELTPDEAANVERHIEACNECRSRLAAYEQVSATFDAYCDAVMEAKIDRRAPRWVPVLVSAVAATLVVYFSIPRARIEPSPILAPTIAFPVPSPTGPELATRKAIHKRRAVPPVQEQTVKWQPSETAVQIAIPAEAMFPPGAMPKGMNFIAELSIAPDGSVKQVRLRQ
jgi:anti-sigma factor RsiW